MLYFLDYGRSGNIVASSSLREGVLDAGMVIRATIHNVQIMNQNCVPKRKHSQWEGVMLDVLNIPIIALVSRRVKWVAGKKPSPPMLKLNTDGSRNGTQTMGGGVLHDYNGDLVFAFAMKFNHSDVLKAELDASQFKHACAWVVIFYM